MKLPAHYSFTVRGQAYQLSIWSGVWLDLDKETGQPQGNDAIRVIQMSKPFLIFQLRPEDEAADDEFAAFLHKGALDSSQVRRIRLDQMPMPNDLNLQDYAGVIVGGGPGCVSDDPNTKPKIEARIEADILSLMPEISDNDTPFLGCCYGIGILGKHLHSDVSKRAYGEPVSAADCTVTETGRLDPILAKIPEKFSAFVGHKEALQELPDGCEHLISAPTCPFQMVRYKSNVYATQFHPEADADGFSTRINIYKHRGYFPPEDADALIAMCHAADVYAPEVILRNFVQRYAV
jgi:GMP synthase (glutamine-hydrolysing)